MRRLITFRAASFRQLGRQVPLIRYADGRTCVLSACISADTDQDEEASMKSTACLTSMVALLVAGCASVAFEPRPSVGPPGGRGAQALGIPPGHLPPPGECRIWIPGRPPGRQAPPGPCDALRRRVPPGSWLISSPAAAPDHVRVAVYDDRRPSVVVAIRLYDTATGRFLRAEEP
jgi:hypothetical protein